MTDDTQPIGATPSGDVSGLILGHLSTPAARNAAEAEAISRAYDKHVFRARRKKQETEWLTDDYIRRVHADMFGTIWEWGGPLSPDKIEYWRGTAPDPGTDQTVNRRFLFLERGELHHAGCRNRSAAPAPPNPHSSFYQWKRTACSTND
jgi:fido (protein-threonine AMPylation protein)